MENNRYNNSSIYKMQDQINGYFYIGSTCNPLSKRLYWHKCDAKKQPDRKVYKYFNSIGWDNVKIILIEQHYLDNKQELIREEDKVIQMYLHDEKCLNSNRAFLTQEEFIEKPKLHYEQNKDEIRENNKRYYEQNKDAIREQQKQYYEQTKDVILVQQKQYYEQNKDEILEKQKQYYDQNKDAIQEKKKIYYENKNVAIREERMKKMTCVCGSEICKNEQSRHFKSKKNTKHLCMITNRHQKQYK